MVSIQGFCDVAVPFFAGNTLIPSEGNCTYKVPLARPEGDMEADEKAGQAVDSDNEMQSSAAIVTGTAERSDNIAVLALSLPRLSERLPPFVLDFGDAIVLLCSPLWNTVEYVDRD